MHGAGTQYESTFDGFLSLFSSYDFCRLSYPYSADFLAISGSISICMDEVRAVAALPMDLQVTCRSNTSSTSCEYCSILTFFTLCLNEKEDFRSSYLPEMNTSLLRKGDLFDQSCAKGYYQGETCSEIKDEDGEFCKICHTPDGMGEMCLTPMQGDMVSQFGVWCDGNGSGSTFSEIEHWPRLGLYDEGLVWIQADGTWTAVVTDDRASLRFSKPIGDSAQTLN